MAMRLSVPKTKQEMQEWYVHVEEVLRGQAKNYKDHDVGSIDRNYIAEGLRTIRMRDYPRKLSLPEAQDFDKRIRELGIPREWLLSMFKVKRYSEIYESEMYMVLNTLQTWVNLYKKSQENNKEQGVTLQEALSEELMKLEEGLPKSFLNSGGS